MPTTDAATAIPHLAPRGHDNVFRLTRPYRYEWEKEGTLRRLTAPAGFVMDMASVPHVLWSFIGPFDLGHAAILHDWLYRHQGALPAGSYEREAASGIWKPLDPPRYVWSRRAADRLFGRQMREQGVTMWRRRMAYRAVRLFGRFAWNDDTSPQPGSICS